MKTFPFKIALAVLVVMFAVPFILESARTALIDRENAQHKWVTL